MFKNDLRVWGNHCKKGHANDVIKSNYIIKASWPLILFTASCILHRMNANDQYSTN